MRKNTTSFTLNPKKPPTLTATQQQKLARAPIDYSDIPELDGAFFALAQALTPGKKQSITVRLDEDVIAWLKRSGDGYQSRMNALLKAMMLVERR